MKALRPVTVTDSMLVSCSVAEDDYAVWSSGTTYAAEQRVISTVTHRIYESIAAGNIGHDPTGAGGDHWLDVGPTMRWSLFDLDIGAAASDAASISITLEPGAVDGLAVMDAVGETLQVQVIIGAETPYDETLPVTRTVMTFLDLPTDPDAQIIVTLSGAGTVSLTELLVGTVLDLGETEAGPTIGIIDYSKRETDDFGNTTIIPRRWSKTMTLRSRVDSEDVDGIQQDIAKLRARPALWLGEDGYDSLSVFGWFKNFSTDLVITPFSYCSFTIEGLAA